MKKIQKKVIKMKWVIKLKILIQKLIIIKINSDFDEDKSLNTEIEKLDQEIFNLKSKSKKIIKK